MGKTAENETLRLKATFYNSLAVGLVLGGVALPYIAVVSNPPFGFVNFVVDEGGVRLDFGEGLMPTFAIVAALVAGWVCRRRANAFAARLQD